MQGLESWSLQIPNMFKLYPSYRSPPIICFNLVTCFLFNCFHYSRSCPTWIVRVFIDIATIVGSSQFRNFLIRTTYEKKVFVSFVLVLLVTFVLYGLVARNFINLHNQPQLYFKLSGYHLITITLMLSIFLCNLTSPLTYQCLKTCLSGLLRLTSNGCSWKTYPVIHQE